MASGPVWVGDEQCCSAGVLKRTECRASCLLDKVMSPSSFVNKLEGRLSLEMKAAGTEFKVIFCYILSSSMACESPFTGEA